MALSKLAVKKILKRHIFLSPHLHNPPLDCPGNCGFSVPSCCLKWAGHRWAAEVAARWLTKDPQSLWISPLPPHLWQPDLHRLVTGEEEMGGWDDEQRKKTRRAQQREEMTEHQSAALPFKTTHCTSDATQRHWLQSALHKTHSDPPNPNTPTPTHASLKTLLRSVCCEKTFRW